MLILMVTMQSIWTESRCRHWPPARFTSKDSRCPRTQSVVDARVSDLHVLDPSRVPNPRWFAGTLGTPVCNGRCDAMLAAVSLTV